MKLIWWKWFDDIDLIKLLVIMEWNPFCSCLIDKIKCKWFDKIDKMKLNWWKWFDEIDLIKLLAIMEWNPFCSCFIWDYNRKPLLPWLSQNIASLLSMLLTYKAQFCKIGKKFSKTFFASRQKVEPISSLIPHGNYFFYFCQ